MKSSAVRQDRAMPVHEFMQTTHLLHHIITGADMKVIGIGQLDLAVQLFQIMGRYAALDGRLGSHVHKDRGLGRAVGAGKLSPPGPALCFQNSKHRKLLLSSDAEGALPSRSAVLK